MSAYQSTSDSSTVSRARKVTFIISRILLATLGGYGFAWGFTALFTILLMLIIPKSEAVVTSTMLGFIVYLLAALWAFSIRSVAVIGLVLLGGGALMTQIAFYLAKV